MDKRKKKTFRLLRFSLRSAFVLVTLSALFMAYYQHRRQVVGVIDQLTADGAGVAYHPEWVPGLSRVTGRTFSYVYSVDWKRQPISNDDLKVLRNFPRMRALYLPGTPIENEGLKHLSHCRRLRRLALWDCGNLDDSSVELLKKIPQLELLDIHQTPITQKGVATAATEITSLKSLIFSMTYSRGRWDEDTHAYGPEAIADPTLFGRFCTHRGFKICRLIFESP